MITNALAVFIGGGFGSLARYGIGLFILSNFKTQLPIATLIANALSCVVFALVATSMASKGDSGGIWRLLVLVGFCGGFSTFSTFSFETVELMRTGQLGFALANIAISIIVCFSIIYTLYKP